MTTLTEAEILACLKENARLAAEHCEALAGLPGRGPTYRALIQEIKLCEGCCRQMAYWRDGDCRWLKLGIQLAQAHKKAGDWLRAHYRGKMFLRLAQNMRSLMRSAATLETQRTGRVGAILPEPIKEMRTQSRPVQVVSPGGIILPPSYATH